MAAFNFIEDGFNSLISCNKVAVDGYEVENLIKKSSAGFIAESFVRTPIDINIEFAVNINLEKINFNCLVGSQKSISFETFATNSPRCCDSFNKFVKHHHHEKKKENDIGTLYSVGKVSLDKPDVNICQLVNPSFQINQLYADLQAMPSKVQGQKIQMANLRCRFPKLLSNVSHLTIRIHKNASGKSSALKWIEVWGQPAYSTQQQLQDDVLEAYQTFMRPFLTPTAPRENNLSSQKSIFNHGSSMKMAHDIPDDFFDPITAEIMNLPMLLPSGYSIDHSTLDKHSEAEAKWGRTPNDPFTGVIFTAACKPVPNVPLKLRIDNYLLKNGSNRFCNGQTLGRLLSPAQLSQSTNSKVKIASVNESYESPNKKAIFPVASTGPNFTGIKRKLQNEPSTSKTDLNDYQPKTSSKKIQLVNMSSGNHQETKSNVLTLDQTITRNIDQALAAVLDEKPIKNTAVSDTVYVKNRKKMLTIESHGKKSMCSACDQVFSYEVLYQLKCSHIVCRPCLMRNTILSKYRCSTCSSTSTNKDISKLHC